MTPDFVNRTTALGSSAGLTGCPMRSMASCGLCSPTYRWRSTIRFQPRTAFFRPFKQRPAPTRFDYAETPDLARFLTAQSGVEMLEGLKSNFSPDEQVSLKWEFGVVPSVAQYMDQISLMQRLVAPAFPIGEIQVTKRD